MAQLSPDSFAFGGRLRRLDDALDDLTIRLAGLGQTETVPVMQAIGRVLAHEVGSTFAIPNFDNSAVDGYAVRFADLAASGETRLPVSLRIPAGMIGVPPLPPGTAGRIFTGAMMPAGADTVFMQEDVCTEGETVLLPHGLKLGSNRRFAGEDFAKGAAIVPAGARLKPQHLAGLAAAGRSVVTVRRRLRVAIFSTGNEIREPAPEAPEPGCQYDANRAMLAGLLAARGMEIIDLGILPDDPGIMARALKDAAKANDAILTSGGVSTGEEDHVKAAIEAAGRLDFWRLAIKPGRPIAMGTLEGTPFLGMPGNPAAVFVTFLRFVGPVLDMLAGAKPLRPVPIPVPSGFDYRKKADRREYLRVSLAAGAGARMMAQRFPKDGAALISSLIAADALAELGEDITEIKAGETISVLPLACLLS
ncbi:MAG: molybdopterin molybdotransferase MoeA [Methylobacterium sp.]|nr:molybdopterin molybdotransferase MoeA [Methylobacterium sp.]MCA3651156.1 molybdopterin molybdotransferase MoeA [Methylobacterium sp.]MCA4921679.1 molybdopterin molybdotransferase MoeA [Methylobacterium sp.]